MSSALRTKLGSVLLAGLLLPGAWAEDPPDVEALKKLHGRIYKVFEFSEEERIYDHLAGSFTGAALDEQFFRMLKAVREFEETESRNTITKLDYEKVEITAKDKTRLRARLTWKAHGLVKHKLHRHKRINSYDAIYELRPTGKEGPWRIVDTVILNHKRKIFPKEYYADPP